MGVIAALTLHPTPGETASAAATPVTCLVCGTFGLVDVTLNLLLFVPFGGALALLGRGGRTALAASFAFTLGIELLQLGVIAGRDASLSDLLTNTTGGVLGHALVRLAPRHLHPSADTAARGWRRWCAVALAHAAVLCLLLRPSPSPTAWYGQRAPELEHLGVFRGEVLDAQLGDGMSFEIGELPAAVAEHGRRTPALAAQIIGAPATERLSPIAAIFDGGSIEQLLLGQTGDALVFRPRLRTADWKLGWPSLALAGAFDDPAWRGTVRGRLEQGAIVVEAEAADGRRASTRTALGPAWGWRLLVPLAHAAPTATIAAILGGIWLFALGLPAGWYAGFASMPLRATVPIWLVVQGVALGALPRLTGFPLPPMAVWIGALLALPAGMLAARAVRLRARARASDPIGS